MSQVIFPVIGGRVVRVTREDACGRPAYGNATYVVSEGFVSVEVKANYDDGDEKSVTNFNGKKCVSKPADPEFTNLSIDMTMCQVEPETYTRFTGMPAEYDPATGKVIGYRINRGVRPNDVSNAVELWCDAQGSEPCDGDEDPPFGYFLWPFLTGGKVSDYTIENNAVTFKVTGMTTKDGSGWGEGPYNVVTDALGAADALQSAIDALDHQVVIRTTIAPPEPTGGLLPLDNPANTNATGATAGSPGVFTPTGNVRPLHLAGMTGKAANPSTAWTTGQYVILGDGTYAHWSGTAWVAGKA